MKLILIGLLAAAAQNPAAPPVADSILAARRIAVSARLAASEYRLGVVGGRVTEPAEVDEARLFLEEAKRSTDRLPDRLQGSVRTGLDRALAVVTGTGAPDSLAARVEAMLAGLSRAMGMELEEVPASAPSLARGAVVYRESCAVCHGVMGRGDGLGGRGLAPPPSNLTDAALLATATPLDFYRRVTIGVAGTAMPGYEHQLSADDRWAVALFASTLRLPPARGGVPAALSSFAVTAGLSDRDLLDSLGADATPARVAAVRAGTADGRDYAAIFAAVRARLDASYDLARAGRVADARSAAIDAYMAFEAVERPVRIKDPALAAEAERAFAAVRDGVGGTIESLDGIRSEMFRTLEKAERAVGHGLSSVAVGVQSFVILVREGLEAILIVGALMAFLAKLGASERRRDLHRGVAAAVAMSVLTAVAIETVFRLSPSHQEALEAGTMVVATVMLFWVSYWLLSKIEVASWNKFVRSRLSEAVGKRSSIALASVAFLAVYREGFETVLFYKALAVSGGSPAVGLPIGLGIGAGAVVLGVVYVAINRYGVRMPLRPFFAVTSAFLYAMAFNFAGSAIAELQEGGLVPLTPVEWLPRVPALGLYPTLESAGAQALLLVLALGAVLWTFWIVPRRSRGRAPAVA